MIMRVRLVHLSGYFFSFYLLWHVAIDLYTGNNPLFTLESFQFKSVVLTVTTLFSFFLYPLAICVILAKLVPQRLVLSVLLIVACIPLIIFFRYIVQEIIAPYLFGFSLYYAPVSIKFYFRDNMYFAVLYSCFGFIYFISQYTQYSAKKQAELSMAAKEAELSLLKSQINPHFLFNSFNSIYTLIYQKSDKALASVEKLSSILRYALYEQREKVNIETELSYLKDFIQLQQLRIGEDAVIDVDLENIDNTLLISPHLLVSFTENAFKHGDLSDPSVPLSISAFTQGHTLVFKVFNKKSKHIKPQYGGIGLQNVKRRLELLYKDRYRLVIADHEKTFSINLSIDL